MSRNGGAERCCRDANAALLFGVVGVLQLFPLGGPLLAAYYSWRWHNNCLTRRGVGKVRLAGALAAAGVLLSITLAYSRFG